MNFSQLLHGAEILAQSGNPSVTGLEYDSRLVKPGDAFIAMRGETSDGNKFIDKAIAAGAVAIVTDSASEAPREGVAWVQVPHGRRALARLSANFYKRPAERLAITGITGTNGKSTTAFLLEGILSAANRKSALIGTIEYHVAGKILPAPHTTPEALDLNRILAEAFGNGATEAVMEVSSHALTQQRVYGIPFDVAVFTNLTRDHLDYHHNMEEYFTAKRILFEGCGTDPPREIAQTLRAAPHSRFVVCDGSVDNVVGVVQAKDILDRILAGGELSVTAALRQPVVLPDTVTALDALERLRGDALGMALVMDEYGSFEGVVTAVDVLLAIVGDPTDAAAQPPGPMSAEGEVALVLDGLMPVDEAKARLGLPDLPGEGGYHTLAGLLLALLRRVPRAGDRIVFDGWRFEVLEMDGRRVARVRATRDAPTPPVAQPVE